jgi:hypothetical protein
MALQQRVSRRQLGYRLAEANRGSSAATDHALCVDQNAGADGFVGTAPRGIPSVAVEQRRRCHALAARPIASSQKQTSSPSIGGVNRALLSQRQ